MPARFLQANIPTYQEGYVNMPLEFLNQKIGADQTKFDTANAAISSLSELNQQVAPWDVGKDNSLIQKYQPRIEELANNLYKTGEVGMVVPQISKLNQEWINDPTRKYLQTGYDHYKNIYEPKMKSEGYGTSYDEMRSWNPETQQYEGWNPNINNYDLESYNYIEDDQQKWLNGEVAKFNESMASQIMGKPGYSIQTDPTTGKLLMIENSSGEVVNAGIDLNNPEYGKYYQEGLNSIIDNIMTGTGNPQKYYQGRYGNDKDSISRLVYNAYKPIEYNKVNYTPGNQDVNFLPEYMQGSGGAGGVQYGIDFGAETSPIGTQGFTENSYKNMMTKKDSLIQKNKDIINNEGKTLFYNIVNDLKMLPLVQDFQNKNPNATEVQIVTKFWPDIVSKATDPNSGLDQNTINKVNGNLSSFNQSMKSYYQNYATIEYLDNLDYTLTKNSINDTHLNTLNGILEEEGVDLSKEDQILLLSSLNNGKMSFKNPTLTDEYKKLVLNSDDSKLKEIWNKFPEGDIANKNQFHEDQFYNLLNDIKKNKIDNIKQGKINIENDYLTITNIGEDDDTESEKITQQLNQHFKSLNDAGNLATNLGYVNVEDLANNAISSSFKSSGDLKEVSFKNVNLVTRGTQPMAAYTFEGTRGKEKGTFTVIAPLVVDGSREQVTDIATELYLKGQSENKTYLQDQAGKLFATANLDDIDQGKIETLLRYEPGKGEEALNYKVGLHDEFNIRVSADSNGKKLIQMTVPGIIDTPFTINNPSDITNFIGQTYLKQIMQSKGSGGNSSGGKSNQGISILQ